MSEPKYRQIAADLQKIICEGEIGLGAQLPTEPALMQQYNVSRNTARNAIKLLKVRGLVEARAGQGVFVKEKFSPGIVSLTGVIIAGGSSIGTRDSNVISLSDPLRLEVRAADHIAADALRIEEGAVVISRHLEYFIGRSDIPNAPTMPWALKTSFYPMSLVERGATRLIEPNAIDDVTYLAKLFSIRQIDFQDSVQIRSPDAAEASFFKFTAEERVYEINRMTLDDEFECLALTVTVYASDSTRLLLNVTAREIPPNRPVHKTPAPAAVSAQERAIRVPKAADDGSFAEFFEQFLPEVELILSATPTVSHEILSRRVSEKLEDLKGYYRRNRLSEVGTRLDRKAVLAINRESDWVAEIKACALFADIIVCEDPFLNWFSINRNFSNHQIWEWGLEALYEGAISRLRRVIDMSWEVMPLIRDGILTFFPVNDPLYVGASESMAETVQDEVGRYLRQNLEIINNPSYRYFKVRIPIIEYEGLIEINRDLWWGDEPSLHEMAVKTCEAWLAKDSVAAAFGLRASDLISGTFWTSKGMQWKLCKDASQGLSPETKIYSFIHEFTFPSLERLSSRDVLLVRNQEDAFYTFRKGMLFTERLIRSNIGDANFNAEIQQIFRDTYEPNFSMIESTMHRNSLLKNLPWGLASTGLAYATAATSSSPIPATIFGTLSAALGFGPLFKDVADKRVEIRREPAYVFWKLRRLAEEP